MLKIIHNHGFFSCCSVRLFRIIEYLNKNKILPDEIDASQLFDLYKYHDAKDVTYDFFENYKHDHTMINYEKNIEITADCYQFNNYKLVDYTLITPFLKKIFTPCNEISNISEDLVKKYNIDVENCIGLYYRGTDKNSETGIDSFESFYNKLTEVIKHENNNNIQIILQTDSAPFLDYMKQKCSNHNIVIIEENRTSYGYNGIHFDSRPADNHFNIKNLFATFLIISKCKYIICSSGNCSIWMMLYRQNAFNIFQNLNKKWM